ncbi:hypothetical protein F4778DRAFT_703450 [Xylariomycetidae sp. FL2044]|nr:hypothetical protein F4778DRAFT_703450 [Xylariomycetidae sp. FL2044]
MDASFYGSERATAPSSSSSTSRNIPTQTSTKIIVPATPDNQSLYNDIRQKHENSKLRNHVTQNNLLSPLAVPMARSTTNDSCASRSPVQSDNGDDGLSPTLETDMKSDRLTKRPRGRRKGPLHKDTRIQTAVKRKLKLTCELHRAKKTSCDCHDFSKLEEGYQSLKNRKAQQVGERRRSASNASDLASLTPTESIRLGTFGTGGAAPTGGVGGGGGGEADPSENEPADPLESPTNALPRLQLQQLVNEFDIDSAHSFSPIIQVSMGQPYYLPTDSTATAADTGTTPENALAVREDNAEDVLIGREMPQFRNRWQCEYKESSRASASSAADDAASSLDLTLATPAILSSSCSWTGPLRELCKHFRIEHHDFEESPTPQWCICTECLCMTPSWSPPPPSSSDWSCSCSPARVATWQRLYWGVSRGLDTASSASLPAMTEEEEEEGSESGFSWGNGPESGRGGSGMGKGIEENGGGGDGGGEAWYNGNRRTHGFSSEDRGHQQSSEADEDEKQTPDLDPDPVCRYHPPMRLILALPLPLALPFLWKKNQRLDPRTPGIPSKTETLLLLSRTLLFLLFFYHRRWRRLLLAILIPLLGITLFLGGGGKGEKKAETEWQVVGGVRPLVMMVIGFVGVRMGIGVGGAGFVIGR